MNKLALLASAAAFAITPAVAQQSGSSVSTDVQQQSQAGQSSTQINATSAEAFVQQAAVSGMFEVESSRMAAEKAESDEVKQFAEKMVQDHSKANDELSSVAQRADIDTAMIDQVKSGMSMASAAGSGASSSATTSSSSGNLASTGNNESSGATGSGMASTNNTTASGATGATGNGMPGTSAPVATGSIGNTGSIDSTSASMAMSGDMQEHQQNLQQLQSLSGAEFDRRYVEMQVEAHEKAVSLFQSYADSGDNEELRSFASETLPTLEQHLEEIKSIQQNLDS